LEIERHERLLYSAKTAAAERRGVTLISIDLRGLRVHIRRAQPADAAASYRWFANPVVTRFLPLAGKSHLPINRIDAYLAQVAASDRPELGITIERSGEGPIGCGGCRNFDGDSAELSIVLGEPASWGQGLGTEAMQLLVAFALGPLGLNRIWLIVRADNDRAVKLFRRVGFVEVERQIGVVVVDDEPRDKLRMQLTRD
jgi:RimJ/RimL family protein N-acetyltransferase